MYQSFVAFCGTLLEPVHPWAIKVEYLGCNTKCGLLLQVLQAEKDKPEPASLPEQKTQKYIHIKTTFSAVQKHIMVLWMRF